MRRLTRLQGHPTIRELQLECVINARRPESNHVWEEKTDSNGVCAGGTYKTDVTSCNIFEQLYTREGNYHIFWVPYSQEHFQLNYHVVLLGLYHVWQQRERIEAKTRISEGEIRFLIEADCCTIVLTYLNKFSTLYFCKCHYRARIAYARSRKKIFARARNATARNRPSGDMYISIQFYKL